MRIQHNIMAMNAYRNYTNNVSAMKKNLERLSSGYKINRAGDDAAGLAISEKMRAQITGLETAQKNAKDGISLVQTAEGALTEVHDMLNRMVELATMSANGTYDNDTDRAQLQKEMDQLKDEINRIADSANFNGIQLLNGDMNGKAIPTQLAEIFEGASWLPKVGNNLGVDTVLNKNTDEAAGTQFTVTLGNVTFANGEDETFTLKVGDTELTLEGDGSGELDTAGIVKALAEKYDGSTDDKTVKFKDADGNDQAFKVEASGNKLTFTQKAAPVNAGQIVDAPKSITAIKSASKGTSGEYSFKVDGVFSEGETLKIGGKVITFWSSSNAASNPDDDTVPKSGNIDLDNITDESDLAAAIRDLFAGDANWEVSLDEDDVDEQTLIFKQINPSTADPLTVEITGAGTVTGTVGTVEVKTAFDAGTPYSYSFSFAANEGEVANIKRGQVLKLGGVDFTFVSKGYGDISKGRIEINEKAKDWTAYLKDIAEYFNTAEDSKYTAEVSGKELILTDRIASSGATAPTAAWAGDGAAAAAPTVTQTVDPSGTTAGEWKLDFNASDLQNGDKISIFGQTIQIVYDGTSGVAECTSGIAYVQTTDNKPSLAEILASIKASLGASDGIADSGGKFTVETNGTDGTLTLKQANASVTENILTADNVFIKGSSASAPTVSGSAPSTDVRIPTTSTKSSDVKDVTAAQWQMKISTAFKEGDVLKIMLNGIEKTFVFWDSTNPPSNGNPKDEANGVYSIDVQSGGTFESAADQAKEIARILNGLDEFKDDFNITSDSDGNIIFTQASGKEIDPALGGPDASGLTATTDRYTTGKATLETVTEPVDGSEGGEVVDFLVDTSIIHEGSLVNGKRLASTVFTLDDIVKDGNSFKVADQTFFFQLSKDSDFEIPEGAIVIDLSDSEDILRDAAIQLTNLTKDNSVFEAMGFDGKNVTFLEKDGQTVEDLSTFENMAAQFSYSTSAITEVKGKSLTLQIGDTSESYNQLKVDIQDMHVASLGLDKISILNQDNAGAAINVIKDAINIVSDVRGTLGATQNRLDHTINNLSVMTENIQDAESTIRDTDVAEEMMAYTKNNILIQSAQAMLAQANQVPQGVLQLLQ